MASTGRLGKLNTNIKISNRVSKRVEEIFAHAVALQQSSRLRNVIYYQDGSIYIINQDHTVLIKFRLAGKERKCFKGPISFNANDYDSNCFTEKDGYVIFRQTYGEYQRDKSCKAPNISGKQIVHMYKKLTQESSKKNCITISKDFLKGLDDNLGHIEFRGRKGILSCCQRNIYSGTLITITKIPSKKTKLFHTEATIQDFPVMGLRTLDFIALFSFVDNVQFCFSGKNMIYFKSADIKLKFSGIIGRCMYDELGVDNGR